MTVPSIPLTINEWDEWGDPRDPDDYACIRSYSPYDNPPAGPRPRPTLLVTGAMHDPRVAVHEPAKWVARLRATAEPGDATILLRVELGAGAHTGPSGRFAQAAYEAEVHAFVLHAMGLSEEIMPTRRESGAMGASVFNLWVPGLPCQDVVWRSRRMRGSLWRRSWR